MNKFVINVTLYYGYIDSLGESLVLFAKSKSRDELIKFETDIFKILEYAEVQGEDFIFKNIKGQFIGEIRARHGTVILDVSSISIERKRKKTAQ